MGERFMTGVRDKARLTEMYSMFLDGKSMIEIGKHFGVTSQAVSFNFKKYSLPTDHGGQRKSMILLHFGIDGRDPTDDEYALYEDFVRSGIVKKYIAQRQRACVRGIAWEFTLLTWHQLWLDSGKIEGRGHGDGKYVMGRFGDVGPYSPSNVQIITQNENTREYLSGRYRRGD